MLRVRGVGFGCRGNVVRVDGDRGCGIVDDQRDPLGRIVRIDGDIRCSGAAHAEDTQYLRVVIGQLRQKLEKDAATPTMILTEPAVGYRLVAGG